MSFLSGVVAGTLIPSPLAAITQPLNQDLLQRTFSIYQSTIPSPNELIMLRYKNQITPEEYSELMARWGYTFIFSEFLYNANQASLSIQDIIALKRRKLITNEEYIKLAQSVGFWGTGLEQAEKATLPSLTINELIDMRYRGLISPDDYFTKTSELGYTQELAEILYNSKSALFSINDLVSLRRRELLKEDEYKKLALASGYDEKKLEIAEKATLAFPTPNDVVRFSVREVYTPSVVEKFGMAQDLPSEYIEEAKKVGMSEELAKQYWLAHWELPSVQMGYEMLHRGVISREELELLLKTADVMPFWRDKLIDISFNPVTRVDVRRLFNLGIYNEQQVFEAYKKIGYTDDDATALTKFTKLNTTEKERDLTKAEILKLYSFKELDREKAENMLFGMGYSNEEAEYLLELEDMKLKDKDTKQRINFLQRQYATNKIDDFTLRNSLLKMNLNNENVERIVAQAEQQRKETIQLLGKDDILKLYKAKIITRETARTKLVQLSFMEDDIELMLKLADIPASTNKKSEGGEKDNE